jgi:hypothetical protein
LHRPRPYHARVRAATATPPRFWLTAALFVGWTLLLAALAAAQPQLAAAAAEPLTAERRAAIVERISESLRDIYVFPDVAEEMATHLSTQLEAGAYDDLTAVPEFAERLTEELQAISHDLHLRVFPVPPDAPQAGEEEAPEAAAARRQRRYEEARRRNFGFERVERLPGNIGYLDLRGFVDASMGGDTAEGAMAFLAGSDALIIDLRRNGGGSPSMIQLITSYFFDEPVHLNSFYVRREDRTDQFWTQAHVSGRRMTEVPIYVLTSHRTFSAAEEFTYNLKNLERATIVGETTGGGAHPVDLAAYPDLGVGASVPFGRAINPITGTNWEGTGVEPDIAVPAGEALAVAQLEATRKLLEQATEETQRQELRWQLTGLELARQPAPQLSAEQLAAYAGTYGPRRIWVEDGSLRYQRAPNPPTTLMPLAEDLFAMEGTEDFRVRFTRDDSGAVTELVGLYADGREEPHRRQADGEP